MTKIGYTTFKHEISRDVQDFLNELKNKGVDWKSAFEDQDSNFLEKLRDSGDPTVMTIARLILNERYRKNKIFSEMQAKIIVISTMVIAICTVFTLIAQIAGIIK